ncbi:MAG: glycoside hydrolase domain-containing protein [Planctomycetota bacterium]
MPKQLRSCLWPLCVALFAVQRMIAGADIAQMRIHAFPDTRRIEVELTADPKAVKPEEHSCRVTIAPKGQKPTKTIEQPTLAPKGPTIVAFEKDDVPTGDVTIAAAVLDKAGKTVFEGTCDLSDPLNPWWLHDATGAEGAILPPYQPLKIEGNAIRPWGRSYRFGPCLLPAEVETRGASLLAGPVALRVSVAGRDLAWTGDEPKQKEQSPTKAVLDGRAECDAFSLSGTALVEYDGMIRIDLELTPKGEPIVDELMLEIPIKPEHAEYLYHFPGKWRSVANSGKLPPEGWKHPFKPFVWLGDNDRGFCWFCESAENWLPEDREDAITIDREDGRVVLRLHLIKGEKVASPLRYTFGFEATPNKEVEKTVWDYRISHAGGYGVQSKPASAAGASIQYPAAGNIRSDQGTAEMWLAPAFDSDPAEAGKKDHTQVPNVTLFWIDVDEKTNCGLFWCGPSQELRIWSRVDGKVLTTLSAPVKWKKGELHHAAFSWGDALRIYLDGELKAEKEYKGLTPKDLAKAALHIGKSGAPQLVDEIRVSDIARAPDLARQPYAPDEHTLLLDHLDQGIKTFYTQKTAPAVATGGPGELHGSPESAPAKHGNGVRLRTGREGYTLLDQLADAGVRTLCFHSQWSWMGYPMPPPESEQDLRDLVKACHAKGIQLLLYASPLTADEAPEWELYHKYFLIEPKKWPYRYKEGHVAPACCWQSRYRNLWLARQAKLVEDYGIDGFYLDGSEWPLDCQNRQHGCGYTRKDGKTGITCNIFATRDYMKRLYAAVKSRKPDGQINIHNSTVMVIPTLGWGTSSWGGEQLGSLSWDKGGAVEKQAYALNALPLDAFRTEFMGRQWGVPSEFLCYERPYTTPQVLSITLLHHVLVRPNMPHLPRISAIWNLHDKFGMKEATWHPYWSNGDLFKTSADHIKVSAYRHPQNGLLMLVSNLSAENTKTQVQFDADRLGMKREGLKARDAVSNEPVDLLERQVLFEMEPFSYRYIWVE